MKADGMPDKSPNLTEVTEHCWPVTDYGVARLTVRLTDIAAHCDLGVVGWIEDGLGAAIGCGARLASGVVIQLVEFDYEIRYRGQRGPILYADAGDVLRIGIEALLAEALPALGLSRSNMDWQNQPPREEDVVRMRRLIEERRGYNPTV